MAAAGIVYDGVGSGGSLFEGKKFWIAQRVPSRGRWVEAVEANGGSVVPLEKIADILIADHLRKDVPAGSYSWTYIEKSIKNGRLENLEDHLAGRPAGSSRPVSASQPAKGSRTPFTAEDDRILFAWVTAAEKKGVQIKGNIIYQDLERANPRHTWQSWRDRWIKYVQFQNRPQNPANGEQPTQEEATPINQAQENETPTSSQAVKGPVSSDKSASKSFPLPQRPNTLTPTSSRKAKFTATEAKELLNVYEDILNIDEKKWNDAWKLWADTYPSHTADEWKEFWETDIRPFQERKVAARVKSSSAADNNPPVEPLGDENFEEDFVVRDSDSFTRSLKEFAKVQGEKIDFELNICGRKVLLYRLWQVAKEELGGFDSVESTGRWNLTATKLNFNTFRQQNASAELRDAYVQNLLDFEEFQHLWLLNQARNAGEELTDSQLLELQLKMPPGHTIFHEDAVVNDETDKKHEFEEEVVEEKEEEEEELMEKEENGGEEVDTAGGESDEEDYDENDLDMPSSPPQRAWPSSQKRYREEDEPELPRPLTPGSRKRQRIDKGKGKEVEIPSTPEDVFNANFIAKKPLAPSPLANYVVATHEEVETVSRMNEDHMFAVPLSRNIFGTKNLGQSAKTVSTEPETQDFHYSHPSYEQQSQSPILDRHRPGGSVSQVSDSMAEGHFPLMDDSSTQSQTDSQRADAELQAFIDSFVAQGYVIDVIVEAMQATTMETGDVPVVIESILKGDGIPNNIEGVWTEEDDQAITTADDMEEYDRVAEKHGEARCMRRRQFLRDKQEALIALGQV